MQEPEHMARRQRHHQQLFRVVARLVAAKRWIRRSRNDGFTRHRIFMRALVAAILARAGAGVSGPFHPDRIVMLPAGRCGEAHLLFVEVMVLSITTTS